MNENITNEIAESVSGVDTSTVASDVEVVNSGVSSVDVVAGDDVSGVSGSDSDSESVDTELVESVLYESGLSVSSGDVSAYSEVERQMDSEILGSINTLNSTLTLVLFFLLFQWIDKKVQAITRGMTNE